MALQKVGQSGDEPLTLAEAKAHLRVDTTDEDALITALIGAAREYAEVVCRRAIPTQQLKLVLDQFPSPSMNTAAANWYGPSWGIGPGPLSALPVTGKTGYEIVLPVPTVISVDSIKYLQDTDGAQITLTANTDYLVDNVSEPARVTPAYGKTWPATRNQINAVEVVFTSGYADVPEGLKAWMKIRVGTLYENREEVAILSRGKVEPLPFVDRLLDPYRVVAF